MNLDFTFVDVLVLVTIILSIVYAAYRGFVSESLSIVAWAAAAFAALWFAPSISPFLRGRITTPLVGTLLAYGGIFLAVLLPLSFVSYRFSQNVKNSPVGPADRILGGVFGVLRGLAVVGLAYIVFSLVVPVHAHPRWLREARLLPLIRASSEVILALVPDQHLDGGEPYADLRTSDREASQPQAHAKHRHKRYGVEDRRELDHLIETTGSDGQ